MALSFKSLEFILGLDKYIGVIIANYGILTYLIMFCVIFIETGLVIMPFLPGDSLVFILGAFSSQNFLNIWILWIILIMAAVLGDNVNYFIGNHFGEQVFSKSRFYNKEYLDKTKEFYSKHGGKTIIYARFMPFIRTFAPFVAGIGKMEYQKFFFYNIIGGVIWITLFLFAGYFFGTAPFVKEHLTEIIILIIILSLIPPIIEYIREKRKRPKYIKYKI